MQELFKQYKQRIKNLPEKVAFLKQTRFRKQHLNYEFVRAVSASSYIEDVISNPLDYLNYKTGKETLEQLTNRQLKTLDDLYNAYVFAQKNTLTKENFFKAHAILGASLEAEDRGKLRKYTMTISDENYRVVYIAPSSYDLPDLFSEFWIELEHKLNSLTDLYEMFFWASMFHLKLELIHPFTDGNGRIGRLLEKWFLSQFLGDIAWFIPSEVYYAWKLPFYYAAIRRVAGISYKDWDFSKALNFLLLLPKSLELGQLEGLI